MIISYPLLLASFTYYPQSLSLTLFHFTCYPTFTISLAEFTHYPNIKFTFILCINYPSLSINFPLPNFTYYQYLLHSLPLYPLPHFTYYPTQLVTQLYPLPSSTRYPLPNFTHYPPLLITPARCHNPPRHQLRQLRAPPITTTLTMHITLMFVLDEGVAARLVAVFVEYHAYLWRGRERWLVIVHGNTIQTKTHNSNDRIYSFQQYKLQFVR